MPEEPHHNLQPRKDPFKEDNFVMHIDQTSAPQDPQPVPKVKKRTYKNVLYDAGQQLFVTLLILVVGFLALNWSAFYQIASNRLDRFLHGENQMELEEEPTTISRSIELSTDPELSKKQIPDLNLTVAPPDNRIIIPKINQNIPIIRVSSKSLLEKDFSSLEKEMQEALHDGVVHYPGTSIPGQKGNVVITGHSSYFPWDPGRFKDVFALLHDVDLGDDVVVYYEQEKHNYIITGIKEVQPENIDVLKQTPEDRLTLITCTPVGTNLRRLVVTATPVDELTDQEIVELKGGE
ncbi:sortase [Patescibacteria group bacterium]|nr:sortase [Patescibacteria group bacterium]